MTVSRLGGLAAFSPPAVSRLMGIGAASHLPGYGLIPVPPPPAGVAAPEIHNLVPVNGANVYKNTFIEFDITESIPLALTEIQVAQGTVREVVFDGTSFVNPYQGSQQTPIVGGFHYVIIRYGGWITSPVFFVLALDVSLNQGTLGP